MILSGEVFPDSVLEHPVGHIDHPSGEHSRKAR